jgi:hypothetical protein
VSVSSLAATVEGKDSWKNCSETPFLKAGVTTVSFFLVNVAILKSP